MIVNSKSKSKLKQPRITELTKKHINDYKAKVELNGGYLPMRTARQFSSVGRATSEHLSKLEQRHEYFSDLEKNFGLVLGFMDNVHAVKTQFPLLNIKKTLKVATHLNIMHPRYEPRGQVADHNAGFQAAVITTDFLIDVVDKDTGELKSVAISIKYDDAFEASDGNERVVARTKSKLAIEQFYWQKVNGVRFLIITDSFWALDPTLLKNLGTARIHRDIQIPPILEHSLLCHFHETLDFSNSSRRRLVDVIDTLHVQTGYKIERLYSFFWYFVWKKKLKVDLFKPIADGGYVFQGEALTWKV